MRKILYFLLFTLSAAGAETAQQLYQTGNDHFQKGAYSEAISAYENSLRTGYESAELYFNLGNAYFKTEQLGKSILNYERAQRLLPNDPDVIFNLELAQLRVIDKLVTPPPFFPAKVWNGIKHALSVNQWALLSVITFNLLILVLIVRLLVAPSNLRQIAGYLFVPLLLITIVVTLLFWTNRQEVNHLRYGIIMAHKVSIQSGPSGEATEVFSLHEGTKVRMEEQSGSYVKVALPDGKIGWVSVAQIEKI